MRFTRRQLFAVLAMIAFAFQSNAVSLAERRLELPTVRVAQLPDGGSVPDVVQDKSGTLHVVYGKGMNAWYTQSRDGGKTFAKPVRLNTRPETVTVGGERGPKIALGKDDSLHVVWQGRYQKGGGVWVTRSGDGGKTFAPERDVLDAKIGIDEPTLTADMQGNVYVLWLDGRLPEDPQNKVALPIFLARSANNGKTFGPNHAIATDFAGRACSCCTLSARVTGSGLVIAFRTGYHDIRDMYLLMPAPRTPDTFQASRVSLDNWKFSGCPMSGPRLAIGPVYNAIDATEAPTHRIYIAWMSNDSVYWNFGDYGAGLAGPPPPLDEQTGYRFPVPGGAGNYPTVVSNRVSLRYNQPQAQVLVVWTHAGEIHWAMYNDAQLVWNKLPTPIATGTAGAAKARPTAIALANGGFVIVP